MTVLRMQRGTQGHRQRNNPQNLISHLRSPTRLRTPGSPNRVAIWTLTTTERFPWGCRGGSLASVAKSNQETHHKRESCEVGLIVRINAYGKEHPHE